MKILGSVVCAFTSCVKKTDSTVGNHVYWTCPRCGNDNYRDR